MTRVQRGSGLDFMTENIIYTVKIEFIGEFRHQALLFSPQTAAHKKERPSLTPQFEIDATRAHEGMRERERATSICLKKKEDEMNKCTTVMRRGNFR